jgi:hypothetical protein
MVDIRREREMIRRKGFDFAQKTVGEAVLWIEYDALNSETHNVYDEPTIGAGRAWKSPILVPVQWVNESEAGRANDVAGRLPTDSIRFAVDMRTLRRCGLSAPEDSRRHLNDLIVYRRNFWRVGDYQKLGRLRETTMVGVRASQIHAGDDMPWGDLPVIDGLLSTVRPQGPQNDAYPTQTFDNHERPAYHDGP